MGSFNFSGGVRIAGNQPLSTRYEVPARASHGALHEPAVRGIYGKNVEYPGTNDATMHLDRIFIFRHGISRAYRDSTPSVSIMAEYFAFEASLAAARHLHIWDPASFQAD